MSKQEEPEKNYKTPELEDEYRRIMARRHWRAACETTHDFWMGPKRDNHSDAYGDALEHDNLNHDGEPNAVVLVFS